MPPVSTDVAMFVGQDRSDFSGMLPTDGDYTVGVYLMRPAGQRIETSHYTLKVGVTDKAPVPLA